jgi:hypothetical protein
MAAYIFDIPIYRCSERRFELQFAKDLSEHLASLESRSGGITRSQAPTTYAGAGQDFRESYGGPWRFNQIIAWLRLCASSSSICADLWLCDAKRFRRAPRRRRFQFVGTEAVVRFRPRNTSREIFAALLHRLDEYEEGWKPRGFVLDRGAIVRLGPFVNWRQALKHAGRVHSPVWLYGFKGTPLAIT